MKETHLTLQEYLSIIEKDPAIPSWLVQAIRYLVEHQQVLLEPENQPTPYPTSHIYPH